MLVTPMYSGIRICFLPQDVQVIHVTELWITEDACSDISAQMRTGNEVVDHPVVWLLECNLFLEGLILEPRANCETFLWSSKGIFTGGR
jgi:hypothetical protein